MGIQFTRKMTYITSPSTASRTNCGTHRIERTIRPTSGIPHNWF
jgi:hypothetical protein